MKAIQLRIHRKTKVPTKRRIVHQFRSDWKFIGKLTYEDCWRLFSYFGTGPIKSDAQFANLIYQSYGPGIYHVLAWRKGKCGFWSFIMLELTDKGFSRIKKEKSYEAKEKDKLKREIGKIKESIKTSKNPSEIESLQKEINDLKEEGDFVQELEDMEEGHKKRGPTPYLKQTQPVYSHHSYEPLIKKEANEVAPSELW